MNTKADVHKIIEELKSELEKTKDPAQRAQLYVSLANSCVVISADKSIEFAKLGIEEAQKTDDLFLLAKCYSSLGISNSCAGNYAESFEALNGMNKIGYRINNSEVIARCYNDKGIVYIQMGDYERSALAFRKALKLNEELGNKQLIATNFNNLADVYFRERAYQKAIEYYRKSIELKEELGDESGLAGSFNGLASAYQACDEFDKAEETYKKALDLFGKAGNVAGIATVLANIGLIRKYKEDYDGAKRILKEAMQTMEEIGDKWGVAALLANLATLAFTTKDLEEAMSYAEKALIKAREIGAQNIMRSAYATLSHAHEKLGNLQEALKYFKLQKEISDHIFDLDKSRQIERLEAKYIIEKKEREAEVYRKASITDALTGLLNRPGIMDKINETSKNSMESGGCFSIIISDIDFFKRFNDEYGHDCGDFVLKGVASKLRDVIGKSGYIGRWGGEEFLILLPDFNIENAVELAEKARKKIADEKQVYEGEILSITMSFGIASNAEIEDMDVCILRADEALYRAKGAGRNRVERWQG